MLSGLNSLCESPELTLCGWRGDKPSINKQTNNSSSHAVWCPQMSGNILGTRQTNKRTWSFLYVRIHTGAELETPTASQHDILDSVFLVLLTGLELGAGTVESDALCQLSHSATSFPLQRNQISWATLTRIFWVTLTQFSIAKE